MRRYNQSQRGGLLYSISMPPCALLLCRDVHTCCGADERLNLGKFDFSIWHVAKISFRKVVFLFLSDLGNF